MPGRLLHWIGPIAILGSTLPLPSTLRVTLALSGTLLGFPAALWPYWWRAGRGDPGEPREAVLARRAAWAGALLPLPFLAFAALGLVGVPVSVLALLLPGVQVVAALAGMRHQRRAAVEVAKGAAASGPAALSVTLVVVLAVLALLAVRVGAPLGAEDDALDHLATIRHLVDSDRMELPGAFHAVDVPTGVDPRKGVLHLALAIAGKFSGAPAVELWRMIPVVLAPLAGLAFVVLALVLFGASPLVVVLAIPSLLFVSGDPLWILKGAYGGHAGLAFAWMVIAGLLAGGGRGLALAAGAGAAALHAYAPVQVVAPLAIHLLLGAIRPHRSGSGPRVLAGPLLAFVTGALPVELGRLLLKSPGENPLHTQAMGWLELPFGPIASPLQLLDWYGLAGAAAMVALLIAAPLHDGRGRRYLVATLIAPLLLLANPWLFLPVASLLGSVGNKLALVWAGSLVALWLVLGLADRATSVPRRAVLILGLGLVFAGVRPEAASRWASLSRPSPVNPWTLPGEASTLIERATPADAVVASDPLTSYAIPALTGRRTIVTLHQHSPPGDSRSLRRLSVANGLGAACVPLSDALTEAREEGATHLLVAPVGGRRIDPFGAHRDPRNADLLEARFTGSTDLLEPLGEAAGFRLFRILAPGATPGERPAVAVGPGPPPGARVFEAHGVELAVHSGALPERASRGGRLPLSVHWRQAAGRATPAAYREVQVHLRVESEAMGGADEGGGFLSKLRRRWIDEPRAGGLLRFRGVELPFRGLCPPDRWAVDSWMPDTLEITVPQSVVAGEARVRVSLEEVSLYPRLQLADLFSNEDRYSGPVLGRVIIE